MTPNAPPSPRALALLASSRSDGNTARLLRDLLTRIPGAGLIDLSAHTIAPYRYDQRYGDDEFDEIATTLANAEAIIFASPVYWYSMSAPMKTFFDRLTDLTESRKTIGKSLAGKTMFLVGSGGSPTAPDSFERPFVDTAGYFNMHWGGMLYGQGGNVSDEAIAAYASNIRRALERC